jgi:hypothetical protein
MLIVGKIRTETLSSAMQRRCGVPIAKMTMIAKYTALQTTVILSY